MSEEAVKKFLISNPDKTPQQIIEELEAGGVTFEDGVKEKILGIGKYENSQIQNDEKNINDLTTFNIEEYNKNKKLK